MADEPSEEPPSGSPTPSPDRPTTLFPELKIGEVRRGQKPGTRYVRVARQAERPFVRAGDGRWRATLVAERPRTGYGRFLAAVRRFLFGTPLATSAAGEERLSKAKALPIFSSDALSSSAYATEEILLALVLAGTAALTIGFPVSVAIMVLLVVVVASYRETIKAYPRGGGTYSVARENLGRWPGLIAAAALLTDYVLTVAVSISAGALAIISAVPGLAPYRVEMAVGAVVLMAVGNLRGLREAGTIFAVPTYLFMVAFGGMIAVGLARLAVGFEGASLGASAPPREHVEAVQSLTLFLVLRAFSSGATALTGVEAIANGVQAFKPPESKNAAITLVIMAVILASFFVSATFLAVRLGVVPSHNESVISQIGRMVFGGENLFYYYLQATTALILVLAANTAFNGFPMLGSILARDEFLPRQFAFRGDRLAYSNGIIVLSAVAIGLLVLFGADTHRLIPLYAIGVFLAFTLSQYGMVVRWRRLRPKGWMVSASVNGLGAALTAVALVVVATTKFTGGAWVVLILIPVLVSLLHLVNSHYGSARDQLELEEGPLHLGLALTSDRPIVVPVSEINFATARAIHYARGLSTNVTALHVVTEEGEDTSAIEEAWHDRYPDTPLIILESPYRSFHAPFMAYIDALTIPTDVPLTIVLPEFVPARWWQRFLHNRTANRLREALYRRPNTVVVSVTQQLS